MRRCACTQVTPECTHKHNHKTAALCRTSTSELILCQLSYATSKVQATKGPAPRAGGVGKPNAPGLPRHRSWHGYGGYIGGSLHACKSSCAHACACWLAPPAGGGRIHSHASHLPPRESPVLLRRRRLLLLKHHTNRAGRPSHLPLLPTVGKPLSPLPPPSRRRRRRRCHRCRRCRRHRRCRRRCRSYEECSRVPASRLGSSRSASWK